MSKRGENIYKRKDGRWEARYIKDIRQKEPPVMDIAMEKHIMKRKVK